MQETPELSNGNLEASPKEAPPKPEPSERVSSSGSSRPSRPPRSTTRHGCAPARKPDNIRKRTQTEIANAHKFAVENFASELLPVKDSLEGGAGVREPDGPKACAVASSSRCGS